MLMKSTLAEIEAPLNRPILQPDEPDHAEIAPSSQPDDTRITREKALAAGSPGSEYWLP
jgi:hypothetical protein